ncbi:DUF805 domain-containing protein [Leucobacter zeae]|nr:DUF805 domain-containing protein [Leucobacter zeae]
MTYPPAPEQPEGQERPENDAQSDGAERPAEPAQPAPEAPDTYGGPAFTAPPAPPAPSYGAPQAPQVPSYGAPQPPQAPQYGAPQYGAPQAPSFGGPQAPQAPSYASAPQYGAPVYAGSYGEPGPGEPFNGAAHPDDLSRPLYGATFGQAVKRFFKNYANFTGRASRSEYWFVALFAFLVELIPLIFYIVGIVILAGTSAAASSSYDSYSGYDSSMSAATETGMGLGVIFMILGGGLMLLIALGMIVPSLAIAWRRLHDGNFAGPMFFLGLIPYVGGLIMIVFYCLPSKPEGRRFDAVA